MATNTEKALEILMDEVKGDMQAALAKMDNSYSMTWMYKGYDEKLFPRSLPDFSVSMKEAYVIKGRKYEIVNVAEGTDVVIIELIESYPDEKTKQVYRTPLVIVIEFKDGKILRGRHYCDPRLSFDNLSPEQVNDALAGSTIKKIIE